MLNHYSQKVSEIILREHERLMKAGKKCSGSDVKLICRDGELWYSRILFYFMQPSYKLLLLDEYLGDDLVIIVPSISVDEVLNFYEECFKIECATVIREEGRGEVGQHSTSPDVSRTSQLEIEAANNVEDTIFEVEIASLMCDFCGKSYATNQKLKAHMWSKHKKGHEDKMYQCIDCSKTFMHQFELNKHAFVHKEPSYVCKLCGNKYKTRASLVRHYDLIHNEKKLSESIFQCDECPTSFNVKSSLTRHKKSHKLYCHQCPQCNSKFKRPDNLQRHLKLVHNHNQ